MYLDEYLPSDKTFFLCEKIMVKKHTLNPKVMELRCNIYQIYFLLLGALNDRFI